MNGLSESTFVKYLNRQIIASDHPWRDSTIVRTATYYTDYTDHTPTVLPLKVNSYPMMWTYISFNLLHLSMGYYQYQVQVDTQHAHTAHWPCGGLMLGQRLRHWPNVLALQAARVHAHVAWFVASVRHNTAINMRLSVSPWLSASNPVKYCSAKRKCNICLLVK